MQAGGGVIRRQRGTCAVETVRSPDMREETAATYALRRSEKEGSAWSGRVRQRGRRRKLTPRGYNR